MERQGELDVLAIKGQSVVAAEVATHILDLDYGGYAGTVKRITAKALKARTYLERGFPGHQRTVAFWAPRVPKGLLGQLREIDDVDLVVNSDYTDRLQQLIDRARNDPGATSNDAYRILQILTHTQGSIRLSKAP